MKIYRFAQDWTSKRDNLYTDHDYDTYDQVGQSRRYGNTTGIPDSSLVNKALRQSSAMAAGVAEYIAQDGKDVTDSTINSDLSLRFRRRLYGLPVKKVIQSDYAIQPSEAQYQFTVLSSTAKPVVTLPPLSDVDDGCVIRMFVWQDNPKHYCSIKPAGLDNLNGLTKAQKLSITADLTAVKVGNTWFMDLPAVAESRITKIGPFKSWPAHVIVHPNRFMETHITITASSSSSQRGSVTLSLPTPYKSKIYSINCSSSSTELFDMFAMTTPVDDSKLSKIKIEWFIPVANKSVNITSSVYGL